MKLNLVEETMLPAGTAGMTVEKEAEMDDSSWKALLALDGRVVVVQIVVIQVWTTTDLCEDLAKEETKETVGYIEETA